MVAYPTEVVGLFGGLVGCVGEAMGGKTGRKKKKKKKEERRKAEKHHALLVATRHTGHLLPTQRQRKFTSEMQFEKKKKKRKRRAPMTPRNVPKYTFFY